MERHNYRCSVCTKKYDTQNICPMIFECKHHSCLSCCLQPAVNGQYKCGTCKIPSRIRVYETLVRKLNEPKIMDPCRQHNLDLEYVCMRCKIRICKKCTEGGSHMNHEISTFGNLLGIFDHKKILLKNFISDTQKGFENIKNFLSSHQSIITGLIDEYFNFLIEEMTKQKENAKKEVQKYFETLNLPDLYAAGPDKIDISAYKSNVEELLKRYGLGANPEMMQQIIDLEQKMNDSVLNWSKNINHDPIMEKIEKIQINLLDLEPAKIFSIDFNRESVNINPYQNMEKINRIFSSKPNYLNFIKENQTRASLIASLVQFEQNIIKPEIRDLKNLDDYFGSFQIEPIYPEQRFGIDQSQNQSVLQRGAFQNEDETYTIPYPKINIDREVMADLPNPKEKYEPDYEIYSDKKSFFEIRVMISKKQIMNSFEINISEESDTFCFDIMLETISRKPNFENNMVYYATKPVKAVFTTTKMNKDEFDFIDFDQFDKNLKLNETSEYISIFYGNIQNSEAIIDSIENHASSQNIDLL